MAKTDADSLRHLNFVLPAQTSACHSQNSANLSKWPNSLMWQGRAKISTLVVARSLSWKAIPVNLLCWLTRQKDNRKERSSCQLLLQCASAQEYTNCSAAQFSFFANIADHGKGGQGRREMHVPFYRSDISCQKQVGPEHTNTEFDFLWNNKHSTQFCTEIQNHAED